MLTQKRLGRFGHVSNPLEEELTLEDTIQDPLRRWKKRFGRQPKASLLPVKTNLGVLPGSNIYAVFDGVTCHGKFLRIVMRGLLPIVML